MSKVSKFDLRKNERGNVLFLILIAVALFAALSYAVTSSSRSGGGDANSESTLVRSASITQYPSSIRTSILRMQVSEGVDPVDLIFAGPTDFSTACDDAATEEPNCIFHPNGGGASLITAPADMMAGTSAGQWYFNANYEIEDIGTSSSGSPNGNDIIAFLPGITNALCTKINEELGISGDTTDGSDFDVTATPMDVATYTIPNETDVIGDSGQAAALTGQAFGCLTDSANENIYYHVLIER